MKLIKFLMSILLIITLAGAGLYYAANHFPTDKIIAANDTYQKVKPIGDMVFSKVSEYAPKNINIGSVLGAHDDKKTASTSSGPNSGPSSVEPQPFEKARYAYCQQVVKDFESRYSSATVAASKK